VNETEIVLKQIYCQDLKPSRHNVLSAQQSHLFFTFLWLSLYLFRGTFQSAHVQMCYDKYRQPQCPVIIQEI